MDGPGSDAVELFVLGGPDVGRSARLEDGALVGRAEEAGLRLSDRSISRRHARVERRDGAWYLVDQGSTNGLWLEDERVDEVLLVDHGELRAGEVLLRARLAGLAEQPPAAPPAPEPTKAPTPAPAISFTAGGGAAATAAPADDELELELEFDEPAAPSGAPPGSAPAASPAAPGSPPPRAGVRDLQREELLASLGKPKGGLLSADLSQYPAWAKALVGLGVLAFLAAVAWGVQTLVLGVR